MLSRERFLVRKPVKAPEKHLRNYQDFIGIAYPQEAEPGLVKVKVDVLSLMKRFMVLGFDEIV